MIRRFDLNDPLMAYALANGKNSCGTKRYWMEPNDLETDWQKHKQDPNKYRYLESHSWLDPKSIVYDLNDFGFREVNPMGKYDGIALGCSYTFGHALPEDVIWCRRLESMLDIRIANLGVNGACISACFRIIRYWLPRLQPKWIFLLTPHLNRVEIINSREANTMEVVPYHPVDHLNDQFLKQYWMTDYNALLERDRSILAIQYLAQQHQCRLITLPVEHAEDHFWPPHDLARDFSHPGKIFQQNVADFFLTEIQKNHVQK
jgi:hypothetical protein